MSENERDVQSGATETVSPTEADKVADLQAQIKRVNAESAGRRKEIDALKAELDKLTTSQLADQQKWQELAQRYQAERDELKPYKAQAESVSETLESLLTAQLADLPDEARVMVGDMPGTAQEKLDWLAKNRSRLLKPLAPAMDAGARGDGSVPAHIKLTPEQEQAIANAQRVDPKMTRERYIARLLEQQRGG